MQQDPSSVPAFAYEHLGDASKEILHVEITQCTGERLELTFSAQRMIDAPDFNAISYTWGNGKPSRLVNMAVNGQTMLVTANCPYILEQAHALRRVPSPDRGCITFGSTPSASIRATVNVEKQYQVAMMGRIFARAAKVACVGCHQINNEDLVQFLQSARDFD